eukprot:748141-Hanusia_phi.AAC.2
MKVRISSCQSAQCCCSYFGCHIQRLSAWQQEQEVDHLSASGERNQKDDIYEGNMSPLAGGKDARMSTRTLGFVGAAPSSLAGLARGKSYFIDPYTPFTPRPDTLSTRSQITGPPLASYRSNHWITQTRYRPVSFPWTTTADAPAPASPTALNAFRTIEYLVHLPKLSGGSLPPRSLDLRLTTGDPSASVDAESEEKLRLSRFIVGPNGHLLEKYKKAVWEGLAQSPAEIFSREGLRFLPWKRLEERHGISAKW